MHNIDQNDEPITRKEIFDYLRNVQKETEIRARLSGINIWVLYGAIGFLVWTLIDAKAPTISTEVWKWSLFLCQMLVLVTVITWIAGIRTSGADIRYRPALLASRTHLSKYWCMRFIWLAVPFVLFGASFGFEVATVGVPIMMLSSVIVEFVKVDNDDAALLLQRSKKERIVSLLIWGTFFAFTIFENSDLWTTASLAKHDLRTVLLIFSLYFLISLLIQRGLADNSDAWTYELERKLLLGLCSIPEALTAIESHALGARLMNVVDRKKTDVTSSFDEVIALLKSAQIMIADIEKISTEYIHERKAQYSKVASPIEHAIRKLETSVECLSNFSARLKNRNKALKDERIEVLIADLEKDLLRFQGQLRDCRHTLAKFETTVLKGVHLPALS